MRSKAFKNLYRGIIPEPARHKIRKLRRNNFRPLHKHVAHEMLWHLLPKSIVSNYVENRINRDTTWCFVVGLNNSGTTLVKRILERHPEVRSLPTEGDLLTEALPRGADYGYGRSFAHARGFLHWTEQQPGDAAVRARYDWLPFYLAQSGNIFLEKSTPNALRIRWLNAYFPNSVFIAIVRNPYAVCEGVRRRAGHSLHDAAEHWLVGNKCLISDLAQVERKIMISYEDLCDNPSRVLQQMTELFAFNAPFSDEYLGDFTVHNITGETSQIRNFNSFSVSRLSLEDIQAINQVVATEMGGFGYQPIT